MVSPTARIEIEIAVEVPIAVGLVDGGRERWTVQQVSPDQVAPVRRIQRRRVSLVSRSSKPREQYHGGEMSGFYDLEVRISANDRLSLW